MEYVVDELRRLSRGLSSQSSSRSLASSNPDQPVTHSKRGGKDSPGNYAKVSLSITQSRLTYLRYILEMHTQPRRDDVWLLSLRSRTLSTVGGF